MLEPLEMLEHVLDIYVNTTSYMALFFLARSMLFFVLAEAITCANIRI